MLWCYGNTYRTQVYVCVSLWHLLNIPCSVSVSTLDTALLHAACDRPDTSIECFVCMQWQTGFNIGTLSWLWYQFSLIIAFCVINVYVVVVFTCLPWYENDSHLIFLTGPNPSSTTPGPSIDDTSTSSLPYGPDIGKPSSPHSPSSTMDSESPRTKSCSISIAAAVLSTFALTATVVVFITIGTTYLWFKGKDSRKIKSGTSSPDLGSGHPTKKDTIVQEEVDMYQISTGDELEGSSGDNSGKNLQWLHFGSLVTTCYQLSQ